jgi:hypothetical protein
MLVIELFYNVQRDSAEKTSKFGPDTITRRTQRGLSPACKEVQYTLALIFMSRVSSIVFVKELFG